MADERQIRKVRKKLEKAQAKGRTEEVVKLLEQMTELEPTAPRWPHKLGDINRKLGKNRDAVMSYSKAVDLYADQGFIARAIAMAKTVLNLDPKRIDILERVDPEAARALHRAARPAGASMAPPPSDALADDASHPHVRPVGPAAIIEDGAPMPAHAGVIPDGDAALADAPPLPPAPTPEPTAEQAARRERARALEQQQAQVHAKQQIQHARTEELAEQQRVRLAARQDAEREAEREAAHQKADLETMQRAESERAAKLQAELEAQQQRTAELMAQLESEKARATELAERAQAAARTAEAAIADAPPARQPRTRPDTLENLALPPVGESDPDLDAPEMLVIPGAPRLPTVGGVYSSVLDSIEELAVAPDAGSDEVRFSNAPPRRNVEIDLTDLEVEDRTSAVSESPPELSAQALSKLPLFPLFAEMPKDALGTMIQGAELVELQDGEALMKRGDPADDLFGIVEGTVRVMARGKNMYLTLSEGDVLGEACLLQDEPRHADVLADGEVTALRIPREVLHEVLQRHPALGELLLELLTRRLLGNLLQTAPLFQDFDTTGKQQLARAFEIRRAAAGTVLTEIGKRMDGLYIALTGKLTVNVPGEDERIEGAGAMFGQDALLGSTPSQCDIAAQVNMVVLRLPADQFSRIAMEHPTMIEKLSELSDDDVVNISL